MEDKNKVSVNGFDEELDLDLAALGSLAQDIPTLNTSLGAGEKTDNRPSMSDSVLSGASSVPAPMTEGDTKADDRPFIIPRHKAVMLLKMLKNLRQGIEQSINMLSALDDEAAKPGAVLFQAESELGAVSEKQWIDHGGEKIVEGMFDGEKMIGPDGKQYTVPANYASKSKLVEGDMMKLTITRGGSFLYKQIGPVERTRVTGRLEKDVNGNFHVSADEGRWRVLSASITYYRGEPGDETVILIPKEGESRWAAVENVIKEE
jgi:hypothetical protein